MGKLFGNVTLGQVVAELEQKSVITVNHRTSVRDALHLMRSENIHSLVIRTCFVRKGVAQAHLWIDKNDSFFGEFCHFLHCFCAFLCFYRSSFP